MIIATDVHYQEDHAIAAAIGFDNFTDTKAKFEITEKITEVQPYISGQFYQRELPCLLQLLSLIEDKFNFVIVDGFVNLGANRPGLGAYLYEAIDGRAAVIGVAKTEFAADFGPTMIEVNRGESKRPLLVTARGIDLKTAAMYVSKMAGGFRIPLMLKRVDQLSRQR